MAALIAIGIIAYSSFWLYQTSVSSLATNSTMDKVHTHVVQEFAETKNELTPDPGLIVSNPGRFPVIESHVGQWGIQHNVHHDQGGYVFDTFGDPNSLPMNSI